MTALLKTKPRPANDGIQFAQPRAQAKAPPRVVPLITLSQPKKKPTPFWLPVVPFILLLMAAAGFWYANDVLKFVSPPPETLPPDMEASASDAEVINPAPSDLVMPIPVLPVLPEGGLPAGIALPASSLQVPDPSASEPAKPMPEAAPVLAAIGDTIKDAPAARPQSDPPKITIENATAPATGRMLDDAQAKIADGDNDGALALYERVLAQNGGNRAALAGKAYALQSLGQYEAAAEIGRRLVALNSRDQTARANLAAALGSWGTPAAVTELQRMLAAKPDFAPAHAALAEALTKQGAMQDALSHAQRAAGAQPGNMLYRLNLAIMYDKVGHSAEAVTLYRQVLDAYEAADGQLPMLSESLAGVQQRVRYLEGLMASAENLAYP